MNNFDLVALAFGTVLACNAYAQRKERERDERQKAAKAEEAAEAARQVTRQAEAEAKKHILDGMEQSKISAVRAYVQIPSELLRAEQHLSEAEAEFESRAFSPFWEKVEATLRCLGNVHSSVQLIGWQAQHFREQERLLGIPNTQFPVAVDDTKTTQIAADATRAHLNDVVRKSQTDFQFSTIYEQRKTNAILIQGFQTLGDAINGLSTQLSYSFDALSAKLDDLERGQERRHAESLNASQAIDLSVQRLERSNKENAAAAAKQREQIAGEQAQIATQQLAMLDNIQRHRRPHENERGPRLL